MVVFSTTYTDTFDLAVFWSIAVATIPLLLWEERRLLAPMALYVVALQILCLVVFDGELDFYWGMLKLSYFWLPPIVILFVAHHFIARRLASGVLS